MYKHSDPHADHAVYEDDQYRQECIRDAWHDDTQCQINEVIYDLTRFGVAQMPFFVSPKRERNSVMDMVDWLDEEYLARYMTQFFDCYCSSDTDKITAYNNLTAAAIRHIKICFDRTAQEFAP